MLVSGRPFLHGGCLEERLVVPQLVASRPQSRADGCIESVERQRDVTSFNRVAQPQLRVLFSHRHSPLESQTFDLSSEDDDGQAAIEVLHHQPRRWVGVLCQMLDILV